MSEFSETRSSSNTNRTQNSTNTTEEGKTTDGDASSSVRSAIFDDVDVERKLTRTHTQKNRSFKKKRQCF